jgi:WD40 repeat protein
MTDLFISYSRDDREFAERIHNAVKKEEGRNAWLDKVDIEKGEQFWREIEQGIDGANALVFLISPTSIKKAAGEQEYCRREIEYAVRQGKRIIPIVLRDCFHPNERVETRLISEILAHQELRERNWLDFHEQNFESNFAELLETIDKDLEYVKLHTQFLEYARDWVDGGRKDSNLLRGELLEEAEAWLQSGKEKIQLQRKELWRKYRDPEPTEDQQNFIVQSRLAENERLQRERLMKRAMTWGGGILAVSLVGAGIATWGAVKASNLRREAEIGTRLEQNGANALNQFKEQQTEGLLTAMRTVAELKTLVQDGRPLEEYPTVNPLLTLQTALDGLQEVKLKGHQGDVTSIDISPDGKMMATAGRDGTARLWTIDGKELHQIKGTHQDDVYFDMSSIQFSPDSKTIVTAGNNNIRLWTVEGKELTQLKGSKGFADSIQFSPNGKMIATLKDRVVTFWMLDGVEWIRLRSQAAIKSMQFSPDGQTIVTAGEESIGLWTRDGKDLMQIKRPKWSVDSVQFSPDGKTIATTEVTESVNIVRLWTLDGKLLTEIKRNQGPAVPKSFAGDGNVRAVKFSPDSKIISIVGSDRVVRLWSIEGKELVQLTGHGGAVRSVQFSPDNKMVVTTAQDGIVRVWSLNDNKLVQLRGHQSWVEDLRISSDSKHILTRGWKDEPRIWQLGDEKIKKFSNYQINGYLGGPLRENVFYVHFSPDSKVITTSGIDGPLRFWTFNDKEVEQIKEFKGGTPSLIPREKAVVQLSPDGKLKATVKEDGIAKIWTLDGKELAQFKGHQGAVLFVQFSPDSKTIATTGADDTVRLWDKRGRQIAQYNGQGYISPNWQYMVLSTRNPDISSAVLTLRPLMPNAPDKLLGVACDRLKYYLLQSPELKEDRKMCGME